MAHSMQAVMAEGTARWADALDALAAAGLPGYFTQTGGMNFALEATLETGRILLITEPDDQLAWDGRDHHGWGVGLYPRQDEVDDGPLVCAEVADPTLPALLVLIRRVLGAPVDTPTVAGR